jgi:hypothetical protein
MTYVLLMASGAFLFGCDVSQWAAVRNAEEANIVSEIEAIGGDVLVNEDDSDNAGYLISLDGTQLTDRALKVLRRIKAPALVLTGDRVSDATLKELQTLKNLQDLVLADTSVTDLGMEYVVHLRQLQGLAFKNTEISDTGLKHIGAITNLIDLDLWGTKVTDVGLKYLAGLTKLQSLGLRDTKVTDSGLNHLKPLVNLRQLELSGTRVTDNGVKKLQEALPNCRIERHENSRAPSPEKDARRGK